MRLFIKEASFYTGFGPSRESVRAALQAQSAIRKIDHLQNAGLPFDIGAEIPHQNQESLPAPGKRAPYWVKETVAPLLERVDRTKTALLLSVGGPGWDDQEYLRAVHGQPSPPLEPAGEIENSVFRNSGLSGPLITCHSACAASTQLFSEAEDLLRAGEAQECILGGYDGRLHPLGIIGYYRLQALATMTSNPLVACRPFDQGRTGFVPGEGSAAFLMSSSEHFSPDASTLAEILGSASTCDAHRLTDPEISGRSIARCMDTALLKAGVSPDQIDLIVSHGTGTPANDLAETSAITRVFGNRLEQPPILALKSMIGHCGMASGVVELALTLACLKEGMVPPILNLEVPLNSEPLLNFVRETPLPLEGPQMILKNSFGFGGQNSCVILKSIPSTFS
ncbi:MAG: beta-ketoacyl-[acyl-carrier-protein] synthase family protein [Verrucomicrobiota bacterium]